MRVRVRQLVSCGLMLVRNQHVVVFGAERPFAFHAMEALLALGANVLAAAPLRTELESLRAKLGQHHRLNVAECGAADPEGPVRLLEATHRRGHLDAILHVTDTPITRDLEVANLSRAIARALPGLPVRVVFASALEPGREQTLGHDPLARDVGTRDFAAALVYDPDHPKPALYAMLSLLSPTGVT